MRSAYSDFQSRCRWGTLSADGVLTGFDKYLAANDEDVRWATTVAAAFEQAGGSGAVSTLANSAIEAALRAAGVDATRDDIVIDPPTAFGNPPTTGYADDPVNTSTGNFLENETDLAFAGATRHLALTRTYNSFDTAVGAFGPGWSVDHRGPPRAHRRRRPDGPPRRPGRGLPAARRRLGPRRRRQQLADAHRVRAAGLRQRRRHVGLLPRRRAARLRDRSRLRGPPRPRGRPAGPARARARPQHRPGLGRRRASPRPRASDGREVTYSYDDAGRLIGATGPLGTRTYRWNDAGLVAAVIDADGVVEVDNTYDDAPPGAAPALAVRPHHAATPTCRAASRSSPTPTAPARTPGSTTSAAGWSASWTPTSTASR